MRHTVIARCLFPDASRVLNTLWSFIPIMDRTYDCRFHNLHFKDMINIRTQ